jgi:hypothetical protein
MAAAVPRFQFTDAAVAGLTFPDRGVAIVRAQKAQFAIVDAGGGAQAEDVALQRDAFERQVLR